MNRGEVWQVNLDPTLGAEIEKIRPCVVVNRDSLGKLPLKIIVPITGWQARYATAKWIIPIDPDKENGLNKKSAADTFQVRSVDIIRLVRKVGDLSDANMESIDNGLKLSLQLD